MHNSSIHIKNKTLTKTLFIDYFSEKNKQIKRKKKNYLKYYFF
ncbi:hypothetical protein FPSM_00285 [Flavobacterium psychrophilum]|nr:hypothetical protein FPSM_00285 [Flavobacterium psychrophilum]